MVFVCTYFFYFNDLNQKTNGFISLKLNAFFDLISFSLNIILGLNFTSFLGQGVLIF